VAGQAPADLVTVAGATVTVVLTVTLGETAHEAAEAEAGLTGAGAVQVGFTGTVTVTGMVTGQPGEGVTTVTVTGIVGTGVSVQPQ